MRPTVRPIKPGDALRPEEGWLVLQVRTELPLRSISINHAVVPFEVKRGTHLRLIAVSAGRHRWSDLGIQSMTEGSNQSEAFDVSFPNEAELRFRVEPGHINYAGMLEVYDLHWQVAMRSVDRTALAIEELRSQFPSIVEKYPIIYSGPAQHVFVERYLAARAASKAAQESAGSGAR